jgi:hypothetical protein
MDKPPFILNVFGGPPGIASRWVLVSQTPVTNEQIAQGIRAHVATCQDRGVWPDLISCLIVECDLTVLDMDRHLYSGEQRPEQAMAPWELLRLAEELEPKNRVS